MPSQSRRSVLKRAAGVLGLGTVVGAGGYVAAEQHPPGTAARRVSAEQSERPPRRETATAGNWVEDRAGPGNTAVIQTAPAITPNQIECTCFYAGPYFSDQAAVVDETMYIAGGGHVRAIETRDGSPRWTSEDIAAGHTPAATSDRLVVSGGTETVTALNSADGRREWTADLAGQATVPTIAYETVYVVAAGRLYALDVTDGSRRWVRGREDQDAEFWARPPAVSAGQVYAVRDPGTGENELVAVDAATGEEQWTDQWPYASGPAATRDHVAASDGRASEQIKVLEASSGDDLATARGMTIPTLDNEVLVGVTDFELYASFFDDRDGWSLSGFSTGALSQPTIAGDTVYVYVGDDHRDEYAYSVLAIDKYSGEIEWQCDIEANNQGLEVSVVATGDAVYVFGDDKIHAVQETAASNNH